MGLLAQGGTGAPPAGGGELGQVVGGTVGAAIITAAVQYTMREDDVFPTGLVTTDLSRAYPALHEWQQWGMRERASAADPPPKSAAC